MGKEMAPAPGGAWRILSFMAFVFAVFLFSYLGLNFGYRKFLEAQIARSKEELTALADQIPKEQQDAYLNFQYQLANVKKLLDNHVIIAGLLPLFEANTNQSVSISGFEVAVADRKINLQGTARSYDVLASQLQAFEESPAVLRYQITSAKLKEGSKVDFTASLTLHPSVFRLNQL